MKQESKKKKEKKFKTPRGSINGEYFFWSWRFLGNVLKSRFSRWLKKKHGGLKEKNR